MDIEKIKKTIQTLKNKVMAIIGEFLKNGEKLEFIEETIKKIDIKEKADLIKRVEFLKARQENLLERSKKFTDEADSLQKELEKYKGIDIKVLGWRVIEVIKNLINKGLTLAKEGEKLFAEINTQNKDVQNLQNYIAKSTKEGFKFSLPKLEEVTKPVSEILKPISTIVLVGAGLFIAFQLGLFRRR